MFKKVFIFIFIYNLSFSSDFTINIKKDSWNLVGTSVDLDISKLNLADDEYLWSYDNGKWYVNKDISGIDQLGDTITANSGFWINATYDRNLTVTNNTTGNTAVNSGWDLYSFNSDVSISDIDFQVVNTVWNYDNGSWKVLGLDEQVYSDGTFQKISSISQGKGYWLNSDVGFVLNDVWTLILEKDLTQNIINFEIAISIKKNESDGTPDIASFIYKGLSLQDGVLSNPTSIFIGGWGDSSTYTKTHTETELLSNAIYIKDEKIYLNLGYVMETQFSGVDFNQKAIYDISINYNEETPNIESTIEIK